MDMNISPEILFCISLFNGGLCAALAKRRGRRPGLWFAIGFGIGLIGLAILAFLPQPQSKLQPAPKKEPAPPIAQHKVEYNWYYISPKKETIGPLSLKRFEELKRREVIVESTYVWNESMSDWKKLGELLPASLNDTGDAPVARQLAE